MPMTCSSFWTMSGDIASRSTPEIVDRSSITTSGSNSLVFTRVQRLSLWLSGYSEIEPQMAAIGRAEEAVAAVGTRKADASGREMGSSNYVCNRSYCWTMRDIICARVLT